MAQSLIQVTSPSSFWDNKRVATGVKLNEEDGGQRAHLPGVTDATLRVTSLSEAADATSPVTAQPVGADALMPSGRF